MTIYSIYIFDRHCQCIFHESWNRRVQPSSATTTSPPTTTADDGAAPTQPATQMGGMVGTTSLAFEEEAKLVYGVVFSLRNLLSKLSNTPGAEGFTSYRTNVYKLHYFETPTSLKFVMNTDSSMDGMREALRLIYANIYVDYVVKNPLANVEGQITNDLFKTALQKFIRGIPGFD
ncbi:Trafficking protein particle complex subunit 1 [Rhizophlyctis rosea]|uniref:Trafficking protein particle complex subunit n=1 Tax=Rhizophlyctis rosea TaxID=64517 RepID=A0AAD5S796_9FUNG|nr:Trafficking protein particle complex subunit 1 [Rhizophlyctis rosea]